MEKLLPDMQRLEELRKRGMTYKEIAAWVEKQTGKTVSPSTVGAALSRAGKTAGLPRYAEHLPWVVHKEHIQHYAARMLRLLGRRDSGQALSEEENRRLDSWLGKLKEEHAVVAYVPDSEEGFYYVDGDWPANGIPVLRPSTPGRRAV